MATVYLAEDVKHRRRVALKVLRPDLAAELGADRFLREIETTAGLRHPHILPLYDSGSEAGVLFYVMPFVEGPSLRDLMDREGQLSIPDALRIAEGIADALSHAHRRGVIHRDIKPENILLEDGRAVVTDFGIAHAVNESGGARLTRAGAVLGTPLYMSPEQANAEPVDARSDLYSLACVVYEMLAGSPPFVGPTAFVVMARHALDPVPPLRTARPGVPPAVAEAVEGALAKVPADRFASVEAWREALTGSTSTSLGRGAASARGAPRGASADDQEDLGVSHPDRPSIAILPFRSLGSEPDQEFLTDGVRYGIQSTLVQLSGLFLVNAFALNGYRGRDVSAERVGEELGVRYVLEGAVQQAGPRIRVTVQLTDLGAGRTIWAERYDRLLDDVFELQDEITREVISSLKVTLVASDISRGWFGKLRAPVVRECLYRGMSHLYEGTREDNVAARERFLELHRVEPDSVMGPSMVAYTYWLEAFAGWSDSAARSFEQAARWAEQALAYEDNNGIGHAVLGYIRVLDRRFDEALQLCSRGIELRASCPLAHGLLGVVHNYCGSSEKAVREVREALQLERVYPVWLLSALAAVYRDAGEVGLSIAAARETLRLEPGERDALLVLCSDYQLAGDHEGARRVAQDILDRDPDFRLAAFADSQPYKDPESLERILQALQDAGLPA